MTHRCDIFHARMSSKGCGCVFPIGESGTEGAFRFKGSGNVSHTADKAQTGQAGVQRSHPGHKKSKSCGLEADMEAKPRTPHSSSMQCLSQCSR